SVTRGGRVAAAFSLLVARDAAVALAADGIDFVVASGDALLPRPALAVLFAPVARVALRLAPTGKLHDPVPLDALALRGERILHALGVGRERGEFAAEDI